MFKKGRVMPSADNGEGRVQRRSVFADISGENKGNNVSCINFVVFVSDSDPFAADAGPISNCLRSNHLKEYPLCLKILTSCKTSYKPAGH